MTINEFTIKDSFSFVKEIFEQESSLYMGSFDEDSLFTNILLEETITICTASIYNQNNTAEDLSKPELSKTSVFSYERALFYFQ